MAAIKIANLKKIGKGSNILLLDGSATTALVLFLQVCALLPVCLLIRSFLFVHPFSESLVMEENVVFHSNLDCNPSVGLERMKVGDDTLCSHIRQHLLLSMILRANGVTDLLGARCQGNTCA